MADMVFNEIPSSTRNPLMYVEVGEPSGNVDEPKIVVIRGQRITGQGSASNNVPMVVFSADDAGRMFGFGSQIHRMAAIYFLNDKHPEMLICVGLADPVGDKAHDTQTFSFTGGATALSAGGDLPLLIGGQKAKVGLTAGMSLAEVTQAIEDFVGVDEAGAVALGSSLRMTASATAGAVAWTARNTGVIGNALRVVVAYDAESTGEALPGNLAVDKADFNLASGSGVADMTTALAALADYELFAHIHGDSTADELAEMDADFDARWYYDKMMYGVHWSGVVASALSDYIGTGKLQDRLQNDLHGLMAACPKHANPGDELAAGYAAVCLKSLREDPALPCHTLVIQGLHPVRRSDRLGSALEPLSAAGFATCGFDSRGNVTVSLERTTMLKNSLGISTDAGENVQVPYLEAAILKYLRANLRIDYARCKSAPDTFVSRSGDSVATETEVKASLAGYYAELEELGWIESAAQLLAVTTVKRRETNKRRFDISIDDGELMKQLRIIAMRATFRA